MEFMPDCDLMKTITVALRRGYHTVHNDLLAHPPAGIKYEVAQSVSTDSNKALAGLKRGLFRFYTTVTGRPNKIFIPHNREAQLIHSTSGFIPVNPSNWVMDVEHVNSFVGFRPGSHFGKAKRSIEKLLSSQHCKKIMPWSNAAKLSIINGLDCTGFENKLEAVYPTMAPMKVRREKHDGFTITYVGMNFYNKGGKELLEAFRLLRQKYDAKLTIVVPKEYWKPQDGVEFVEPGPREMVYDIYKRSDVFAMPSYHDSYGMVYIEAMNFGLPIVATKLFAIPEIVGNAGILIKPPVSYYNEKQQFAWSSWIDFTKFIRDNNFPRAVDDLHKALKSLADSSSLRNRLGRAGRKRIESGPVSIKARNKKLKRIYEEAIRF